MSPKKSSSKLKLLGRILGIFLIVIVATVFMAVTILWFFPGTIISSANFVRYAEGPLKGKGITLERTQLNLSARSESFWKKEISFSLKNFCLTYSSTSPPACGKDFEIKIGLDLLRFKLHKINLLKLVASSDNLVLDLGEPASKKEPPSTFNLWSWIKKISIGDLDINLKTVKIKMPEDELNADVSVQNHTAGGFKVVASVSSKNKKSFQDALVNIENPTVTYLSEVLSPHQALIKVNLAPQSFLRAEVSSNGDATDPVLKIVGTIKNPKVKSELFIDLAKTARDLSIAMHGTARLEKIPAPLEMTECKIHATLPQPESSLPIEAATLNCNFKTEMRSFVAQKKVLGQLPSTIKLNLSGQVATNKSAPEELKGRLTLALQPVKNSFLTGDVKAHYELIYSATTPMKMEPVEIDGNIEITKFLKFAGFMNAVGILIPSPVNVLNGTAALKISGKVSPQPFHTQVGFSLTTDLKSSSQRLNLETNGDLEIVPCVPPQPSTIINLNVVTNDVLLVLPNVDPLDPPALVPDSRFVIATKQKAKPACPTSFNFSLKNDAKPILISGDILKADLPLNISLQKNEGAPLKGNLHVTDYHAEFFRRKGVVENFDLNFATNEISGKVRVDYADYRVYILLSGTTDSANITLQSDPPLPRDQALALLLYGKSPDLLDADQNASVKNADAAATNGALSLASLYIFASTPIETIGYDPNTNGVSAKVKLGNGTSLNVGANSQGLTDLGITKRLSKHWRIQTTLNEPGDQASQSGRSATTLLEWFQRF